VRVAAGAARCEGEPDFDGVGEAGPAAHPRERRCPIVPLVEAAEAAAHPPAPPVGSRVIAAPMIAVRAVVALSLTAEGVPPAILGGFLLWCFAQQRAYAVDFGEEDSVEDLGGWVVLVRGSQDEESWRRYNPAHTPCTGESCFCHKIENKDGKKNVSV
jgi:hypothetical protein